MIRRLYAELLGLHVAYLLTLFLASEATIPGFLVDPPQPVPARLKPLGCRIPRHLARWIVSAIKVVQRVSSRTWSVLVKGAQCSRFRF